MTVVALAAGVDTWSPCWYVDPDSPAGGKLDALATLPIARGAALPEAVAGHRVGWLRAVGLLYAEGHPGGEGVLGRPDNLPAALDALERAMLEADVPVPTNERPFDSLGPSSAGRAGVRRCDATVDLSFDRPSEGLASLAGVAAVLRDAPRSKCDVYFDQDVETVYLRAPRRRTVLGRWYDKGVESGRAPRGTLIRPEDQRRWAKGLRRDAAELTGHYVREKFHHRFAPLWRASKGVTVAGPMGLAEKIARLVSAGELTPQQAETILGYVLLEQAMGDTLPLPNRTARKRRAQLRDHGLVVADGIFDEVEVRLDHVLEAALDSEHWGARG